MRTKLRIGKRNIKTAIAVFLSMLVSRAFKLEYPFFAVIAAIFTMENSLSSSYKAGLFRLTGTLVGAFVGVIFIYIQPANPLLMGLGILLLIFICNTFKCDRAVPIAGVVFASIMLTLNSKDPLKYSAGRVLDTFVGIVIAVAVNYLVFPPNNLKKLRKDLDAISAKISEAVVQFACAGGSADLNGLRIDMIESVKTIEAYKTEFNPKINRSSAFSQLSEELEALRSILAHLRTIDELGRDCRLSPDNAEMLKALKLCDVKTEKYPDNSRNLIYNYHVGKILDILPALTHQTTSENIRQI